MTTNTEKYLDNMAKRIFKLAETDGDVELNFYEIVEGNVLRFEIKTLTSVSDPEVNYFDDGLDSIEYFQNTIKNTFQVNAIFEEDFEMTGNEYDEWVVRDGWLTISP